MLPKPQNRLSGIEKSVSEYASEEGRNRIIGEVLVVWAENL